ncbi:DUF4040 domain-containing protein [Hirschia litorea]|uniref:DUF4040 domain-containing protein n=1 Tax=Hirschia litorea TaxID=1199156 RepID=A0ABW2IJ19_9PROT
MEIHFITSVLIANIVLMAMLGVITIAIIRMRSLFSIVMLSGVYSLISAAWFQAMDAVDVSFTEAAVGAGVSTSLILAAMLLTVRKAKPSKPISKRWAPLAVVIATGAVLVYASTDLPSFGDAFSPANSYVGQAYVDNSPADVGTPNIVTAVLASYRGFDTFGETVVVFAAGIAVILLLGFGERARAAADWRGAQEEQTETNDDSHLILRVVAKFLLPLIIIFAFYVHLHGEISPGGGFQAGVIFAVAIMLYALIFGLPLAMKAFPPVWARAGAAIGVAVFGLTGVVCMLNGGRFLDYDYIFGPPTGAAHGHHNWPQVTGIIAVEVGVVVTVACVMITAFYAFAGRVPEIRDEDW